MYVYPLSVNYTSRSTSARNIAVRVQFMDGEDFDASALEVNKFVTDSEANNIMSVNLNNYALWTMKFFWFFGSLVFHYINS